MACEESPPLLVYITNPQQLPLILQSIPSSSSRALECFFNRQVRVCLGKAKMSVEILDGSTIREFVEDEGAFNGSVEERFATLDMDRDGRLTYSEMARELMSLRVREIHFGVDEAGPSRDELLQLHLGLFRRFDRDGNGTVELEEFRAEMREVMMAVASGLGFLPVQMVVEEGSFLKRAVERETAKHVA
ncbi:hypothetical protein BHE74_00001567 [Ensete ventricosum]|nr:hypothetical protein GW17_00042369 [Ensete ventricosum]RWW89485.1 hypothetical protein BHE74_00001567 [Ensete ventricosum]